MFKNYFKTAIRTLFKNKLYITLNVAGLAFGLSCFLLIGLYAFDELSGFVHAYSLMRPAGYEGMDLKGVKKRLKEKGFAANVSREDINDAANRCGIALDELIGFVIAHQRNVAA